jgi:hypothetical protein
MHQLFWTMFWRVGVWMMECGERQIQKPFEHTVTIKKEYVSGYYE